MKTLKLFLLSVRESLEFGWQAIRYALIFVSAFFRQRASLGCEMVAMRSQLTFYKESIRQKRQPRPRFNPAFRLLWVLLSRVWSGWKSAANLMKPKTVLQWHASTGCAFCCDGASHDGLGDAATAGSDALWSTTQLFVP